MILGYTIARFDSYFKYNWSLAIGYLIGLLWASLLNEHYMAEHTKAYKKYRFHENPE